MKEKFTEKYSKLIEAGRLELVSAPLDYYPQYIFQHGKGIGQLWARFKVDGYFSPHGETFGPLFMTAQSGCPVFLPYFRVKADYES